MIDQIKNEISALDFLHEEEVFQRIQGCIQDALQYNTHFCDYFISDFLMGKEREAKSLFLFSDSHLYAFPKLFDQDQLQIFPYKKQIQFVDIKKKSFDDRDHITIKSRYLAIVSFVNQQSVELKASGINCSKALSMVQKHILPNLL
ncbi:MAG: hypothetical protein PHI40_00580 [Caldisericia bacterium]|nr:hypothetical protein [Caldisericia bacterium]MDD4613894.1 hypothetical protein [Caldisericia bacterium]